MSKTHYFIQIAYVYSQKNNGVKEVSVEMTLDEKLEACNKIASGNDAGENFGGDLDDIETEYDDEEYDEEYDEW